MNNTFKYIFLIIISVIIIKGEVFADKHKNFVFTGDPRMAPTQTVFMQANNINSTFISDGVFGLDKITFSSQEAGTIWPVTSQSRKTINFGSGLWVGAKWGPARDLRVAAAVYNSHYSPGNIPVPGQVPGSNVCSDPRYRAYVVQLTDPTLVNGGSKQKLAGGRTYTFNFDAWANWPVDLGAPYVEVNGIPGYQPSFDGDRPGIGNSEARPDELVWMTYMDYKNCTNAPHVSELSHPGNSLPLGVEIQQLSFAFNSPGLTDMFFMKWIVINKSGVSWDSTYISVFDDPDVGDAFDDAAGSDSTQDVGFCYNKDNLDPDYGEAPPAFGYRYLQSPIVFTGNPADTAFLPYDTLVNYRQIGLSSFVVYKNGGDECTGDPDDRIAGYNFMSGTDGCKNPIINRVTNLPTRYTYSGNACTQNGWIDSAASDRRFLQSSGPFTMNNLDTQVVVVGAFVGQGSNNFQSVCVLLNNAARVKRIYDLNFRSIPLPPAPQVTPVAIGDGKITLYWGNVSEFYREFDKIDLTGYWDFQGYEIYQIKPGTGGDNEADRTLLAVYDIKDSITSVYDSVEVLQPNGTTQIEVKPQALGTNSGISRYIVLNQNAYPQGVNNFFINGQDYKFSVVAYGVNKSALKPAKVLKNTISAQIITVTPNLPMMGTTFTNKNLDTLVTNRVDKGFLPVVIDPVKVISARYQMVFSSDSTWNLVRIINNSQVDTLSKNNTNLVNTDNRASIFDGILFKADQITSSNMGVIRDPVAGAQTSGKGWTYSNSNINFAGVDTSVFVNYPSGNYKPMQSLSMGLSWFSGNHFKNTFTSRIDSTFLKTYSLKKVKITFGQTQKAYRWRGAVNNSPYQDYVDVPFKVEIDDPLDTNSSTPRQVNIGFFDGDSSGTWNPKSTPDGGLEMLYIFYSNYSDQPNTFYTTKNINFPAQFRQTDAMYIWWPRLLNNGPAYQNGDILTIIPYTKLKYQQSPGTITVTEVSTVSPIIGSNEIASSRGEISNVRVVPNPYYGGHSQETSPFDRYVKFMNMPKTATIYIYSLNGNLVRQINKDDNTTTINWDLLNTDRIPVASGIYIAFIDAPGVGTKTIKMAIFTPEERLDSF